jgi:hypothetical protein
VAIEQRQGPLRPEAAQVDRRGAVLALAAAAGDELVRFTDDPEDSGSCLMISTTVGAPCRRICSWVTTLTGSAASFDVPAISDR